MSWFDENADPSWQAPDRDYAPMTETGGFTGGQAVQDIRNGALAGGLGSAGAMAGGTLAPSSGGANPDVLARVRALGPNADLRPLAAELGMTRDQLAEMRDTAGKQTLNDLRTQAAQRGLRVDEGDGPASELLANNGYDVGRTLDALGAQKNGTNLGGFARGGVTPYQPFTDSFDAPTMPGDLADKWDKTFAWDPSKAMDDPALQARMAKVQKQRERYAAANGTLLTGGTTAALDRDLMGEALQGEDSDFNRSLAQYNTNFSTFSGDRTRRQGVYQGQFDNARASFLDKAGIYNTNESGRVNSSLAINGQNFDQNRATTLDNWQRDDTLYNRGYQANRDNVADTFRVADYGYGAATNLGNFATSYGRNAGDTTENIGNTQAAGQVGSANAWTNGAEGAVNGAVTGYLASRPSARRYYAGDPLRGGATG